MVVHDGLVSQVLLRKARRMVLSVMCVSLAVAAEGRAPVPEKFRVISGYLARTRSTTEGLACRAEGLSHEEPRVSRVADQVTMYASRACLIEGS